MNISSGEEMLDIGFQDFNTFLLETRDLDKANKDIIIKSRKHRLQLGNEGLALYEYTLHEIMTDFVYPLPDGAILSEYTHNDDVDDLRGEVTDQGHTFVIQVKYLVSFRLVKLISSFDTIRLCYQTRDRPLDDLYEDLMRYFVSEKLINEITEDMTISSIEKSILKWIQVNNTYCKVLYQILNTWPIKTTANFFVYTGLNYEIPDVGHYEVIYRQIIIDGLKYLPEGNTIEIPFVLSTSISPDVAKRFSNGMGDKILQICIPKGFRLPYISGADSEELEVLLNMYGIYRKVNKGEKMNSVLQDVEDKVICVELVGFRDIDLSQLDENTTTICDIITQKLPAFMSSPHVMSIQETGDQGKDKGGGNNKKIITKKRYNRMNKRKGRKTNKRKINKNRKGRRSRRK